LRVAVRAKLCLRPPQGWKNLGKFRRPGWPEKCFSRPMLSTRVVLFSLAAFAIAAGCGGKDVGGESTSRSCSSDAECGANERCDLLTYPRIRAMCSYAPCGTNGECAEGLACQPPPPGSQTPGWGGCAPLVCAPHCRSTGCATGQICRESGVCGIRQCDEPGVEACPEHWRCDPAAAIRESTLDYGAVVEGTPETDSITRGCVRLRCNETGGYSCKEFWECAPTEATMDSGCVPMPCGETGHCETDAYICEPTSTAPRSPGADFFGCALKNCEEGRQCISPSVSPPGVAYCDPSAPNANSDGCALRKCDDGNTCVETYVCAPDSPDANIIGCIPDPAGGGAGGTLPNGDGRCVER
jgi:hypothetical protein